MHVASTIVACDSAHNTTSTYNIAKENRHELEKVLIAFQDDSFKYAAAEFLIDNMMDKFFYEGPALDSMKLLKSKGKLDASTIDYWNNDFDYTNLTKVYDAKIISSQHLINHIEHITKIWQSRPWQKYYSFQDFCEYVLPYRIDDEPLEYWCELYYNKYSFVMDSILNHTKDIVEVANCIANVLKEEGFNNHSDIHLPHLGAKYLFNNRLGYCRENCDIAIYTMRSLGIPISSDFYITSPSYNSTHSWNAIIDTTHLAIPFNYTEEPISRKRRPNERKKGKVYRKLYGNNNLKYGNKSSDNIPQLFKDPHIIDVSEQYFAPNKHLKIKSINDKMGLIYLCIFNRSNVYRYIFLSCENTQINQSHFVINRFNF